MDPKIALFTDCDPRAVQGVRTGYRRVLLLAILLTAAIMRLWAIDFGFPGRYRPDEEYSIATVQTSLAGDFNPFFFIYPALFPYLITFTLWATKWVYILFGLSDAITFQQRLESDNWALCYLAGRLLTCSFGISTVYVIYILGRRVSGDLTGLIASFILSFCFLHARDSKFATTDVPMTFFVTLTFVFLINVARKGFWRDCLIAAACAGAAIATKYSAAPIGLSFAAAFAYRLCRNLSWQNFLNISMKSTAAFLISVAAFGLCTPYCFLRWHDCRNALEEIRRNVETGWLMGHLQFGWSWYFNLGLRYSSGWAAAFLCFLVIICAPIMGLARRRINVGYIVIVPFILANVHFLTTSRFAMMRYLVPMMPCISLLCAWAIVVAASWIPHAPYRTCFITVLLIAVIWQPATRIFELNHLLSQTDTREQLRTWMSTSLPPGSIIRTFNFWKYSRTDNLPNGLSFLPNDKLPTLARTCSGDQRQRWALVEEGPEHYFINKPSSEDRIILETQAQVVATFDPFTRNGSVPVFEAADAFWVPWAGFDGMKRPGPLLKVYEFNCKR